jgi:two-component system, NtrC family, sensor kinase
MNLYSVPPLLTLLSFLGLGVLTLRQGRLKKADILLCIICLLGSFLYIDILLAFNVQSAETALFVSRTDHFFIVYLFPVYVHFFHVYLKVKKRQWLIYAAYAYSFVLMWLTRSPRYIESMHAYEFGYFAKSGSLYPFFGMSTVFATVYTLYLIHRAIRHEKSDIGKYRLRYIFAGFGILGLLNAGNVLPIMGYPVYPPGNWSFIPLVIFGFGLFRHDLLGKGALIQKGLIYTLFTSFLTAMYAVVIFGAEKLTSGLSQANSFYFSLGFIFLAAFTAAPVREKIQAAVNRFFFRGQFEYRETIKSVGRTIPSVLKVDDAADLILEAISTSMQVTDCALFLKESNAGAFAGYCGHHSRCTLSQVPKDTPMIDALTAFHGPVFARELLERAHRTSAGLMKSIFESLKTEIVLPLKVKSDLIGFISLGTKRSGDLFTPEDLDLLEILADQGALAFENAKHYRELTRLNEDLENTVAIRTRELRTALSEKEKSQEQLIRSESLASIGQLVAGAAHELNNPLASAISIIQSSIEDLDHLDPSVPLGNAYIDDLQFAEKELKRAKNIVGSLLGLSRQTQTFTEKVNLNRVIEDALRVLSKQYRYDHIEILEDYDRGVPEIYGNFANLGQVAINIIQNAIQAMGDIHGRIHLYTRYDENPGRIRFGCKDAGPGIDENLRKDIFKPFFTTKPEGKGTGLGLYICHEIVKKHGGTISMQDNDGQGAHFVVVFPFKKDDIQRVKNADL